MRRSVSRTNSKLTAHTCGSSFTSSVVTVLAQYSSNAKLYYARHKSKSTKKFVRLNE